MQGELGRIDVNNPNYILELGVGPPVPNLVPQQPGTGAVLAGERPAGMRFGAEIGSL